jgi:hypothetical protein
MRAIDDLWMDVDGERVFWPKCIIRTCTNRICLAKGEVKFCWPHSSSGQSLDELLRSTEKVESAK